MRKGFYLGLFIVLFQSNSFLNAQDSAKIFNLTANEFSDKINQFPNVPILDVRTPIEFAQGHIAKASNLDWNSLQFKKEIDSFDKFKPVFVYCLSGGRSSSAADFMRSIGFKQVYELSGGILNWREANLPLAPKHDEITFNPNELTKTQFDSLLISDKIVIIDFYAEWCGPCKRMKPFLDEISVEMANKVKVYRIDVDKNMDISNIMKITEIPTLLFYKNSKLILTQIGFIPKKDLIELIP
ncbi:MAG: thioredoxin [Bacteroidota bacterium]|nr:thioredoxin [Bacteroidota bacterium]